MPDRLIFWDVDTQHDFMDADGKLYVPGAEEIKPRLARLTDFAHERGIRIVASADDHVAGHRELSDTPDFRQTFPDHCIHGTRGARKIPETALFDPLIIEPEPIPQQPFARQLAAHDGDILIRKHWFDVFTNPNAELVLETLAPETVVVYGVALDVCNRYAIEGMLGRGIPRLYAVTDATRAIRPEESDTLLADWRQRGVRLVTTDTLLRSAIA